MLKMEWTLATNPPEREGCYLVVLMNTKVDMLEYSGGRWKSKHDPSMRVLVTHWMPLPEPPKKEESA